MFQADGMAPSFKTRCQLLPGPKLGHTTPKVRFLKETVGYWLGDPNWPYTGQTGARAALGVSSWVKTWWTCSPGACAIRFKGKKNIDGVSLATGAGEAMERIWGIHALQQAADSVDPTKVGMLPGGRCTNGNLMSKGLRVNLQTSRQKIFYNWVVGKGPQLMPGKERYLKVPEKSHYQWSQWREETRAIMVVVK